jgi:MOSC domain-containing protein YiiM
MILNSVNVGSLEKIPWVKNSELTGIFKKPAIQTVRVGYQGLESDHIGSVKYHGGPDQAVYVYAQTDYDWWEKELGRGMQAGIFGENFTISDWGVRGPRIGDRWKIGRLELELTGPRVPCVTLAHRMKDPKFVKRFLLAGRSGAYARVLTEGSVRAGQTIEVVNDRPDCPTIDEVYSLWRTRPRDVNLIRDALEAPIASRIREDLEMWLLRSAEQTPCR